MTYVIAEPCIDINRRKRSRGLHLAKIASDPSQEGADATSSRASRFPPVTRGRNWPGLSQMNRSATHGERQGPAQRRLARFERVDPEPGGLPAAAARASLRGFVQQPLCRSFPLDLGKQDVA
jgi:hypothetical protein